MRGALLCLLLACAAGASRAAAPDVLLVSVDDLRADRVRPELMPALSRLAGRSLRFGAAFSQASWTIPSHATLMTSRHPSTHGAGDFRMSPLPAGPATLAEVLGRAGYATAAYTQSPYFDDAFGLLRGFAVRSDAPLGGDPLPAAASGFLSAPAPVFVFVHVYGVHQYLPGADKERLSPAELRRAYDAAARRQDEALGRFFSALEAAGRWDGALVVVTADHGEALGEGGRRGHALQGYDEQLRVPLLVKLPGGARAGTRVDAPVRLLDVAPTILDALGQGPFPGGEGRSLLPLAEGPAPEQPVFADLDLTLAARSRGWKLILSAEAAPHLYDLAADPGEARDRAGRGLAEETRLRALLREHEGRGAGWHLAVSGPAGSSRELTLTADAPFVRLRRAFTEPGDCVEVSADSRTVTARFTSSSAGDEDSLVVEWPPGTSASARDAATGRAWTLVEGGAYERAGPPPASPGVSLWRVAGPVASGAAPMPEALRASLRAAGYAP
jgi:hypothetical protein